MASNIEGNISPTPLSALICLPPELLASVLSYVSNRDIKSLRLTCNWLGKWVLLRIPRVFLSANQRDIDVFRAIADDERYCGRVVEIVWDDAHLAESPWEPWEEAFPWKQLVDTVVELDVPRWFVQERQKNVGDLMRRKRQDRDDLPHHVAKLQQLAAQLPLKESWIYYRRLLQQQAHAIRSGADVTALRHGLQRFASLSRVSVTPAAHGFLFTPLYETPTIRALPSGFNYPLPRGWPTWELGASPPAAPPWVAEDDKSRWRGVSAITRMFAQEHHRVLELVLDTRLLSTGLNCHVFDDAECDEYQNLVALLGKPGFRRIDLALAVGGQEREAWSSFSNGHLRDALGKATDLHHVSLSTDAQPGAFEHFIPLRTVFPVDKWQRLRHFGLSRFVVQQADLLSLLAALPPTLRSVELSFLDFPEDAGNYQDLLKDMRRTLGWHGRAKEERPKVAIGLLLSNPIAGRAFWIDKEVNTFLYDGGENPFFAKVNKNLVFPGKGAVERDEFEPGHERPYTTALELIRLGYSKQSDWLTGYMERHVDGN